MTGFFRWIGGRLARLFKRKAKEVVEEVIEEVTEELSDVFGVYSIQGKAHGLPRRVYADGTVRIGNQVIHPGRKGDR